MICRKCGAVHQSVSVGFKASCEKCRSWLHACVQCALWDRTAERCRSLSTEQAGDREGANFCEEYVPNTVHDGASDRSCSSQARERFLGLFGKDDG